MQNNNLRPTLWRTCRTLLNSTRLRMLKIAFENEGNLCVRDYAKILSIPDSIASIYLRQLNARGLIGVKRDRIKVFYNGNQDRSLPDSIELQKAFVAYFASKPEEGWVTQVLTTLRAFSHFNRLAILIRLAQGPAYLSDLYDAMGVCVKSGYHHLGFLAAAGLIHETKVWRKPSVFELVEPRDPIGATLLRLVLGGAREGIHYYNEGSGKALDKESKAVLRRINKAEGNPRQNWRETGPVKLKKKEMPQEIREALKEDED